jgi:hypothetical protein
MLNFKRRLVGETILEIPENKSTTGFAFVQAGEVEGRECIKRKGRGERKATRRRFIKKPRNQKNQIIQITNCIFFFIGILSTHSTADFFLDFRLFCKSLPYFSLRTQSSLCVLCVVFRVLGSQD